MRVGIKVESLRCTTGGSNKGYQIIEWFVEGTLVAVTKVYGSLSTPSQADTYFDGSVSLEDHAFKTLKNKLKKYNRAHPAKNFEWSGDEKDWVHREGMQFINNALFYGSDLWNTNEPSMGLNEKLKLPVRKMAELSGSPTDDTEVDDLFRTPEQREQVRAEREEQQNLNNWGCF